MYFLGIVAISVLRLGGKTYGGCFPDASQMLPAASQMLPDASRMSPDASQVAQDASQKTFRCL